MPAVGRAFHGVWRDESAPLGVPATGRSVSTEEFAFYRIDAAQIAEVWGTGLVEQLLHQIRGHGSDPPP